MTDFVEKSFAAWVEFQLKRRGIGRHVDAQPVSRKQRDTVPRQKAFDVDLRSQIQTTSVLITLANISDNQDELFRMGLRRKLLEAQRNKSI